MSQGLFPRIATELDLNGPTLSLQAIQSELLLQAEHRLLYRDLPLPLFPLLRLLTMQDLSPINGMKLVWVY